MSNNLKGYDKMRNHFQNHDLENLRMIYLMFDQEKTTYRNALIRFHLKRELITPITVEAFRGYIDELVKSYVDNNMIYKSQTSCKVDILEELTYPQDSQSGTEWGFCVYVNNLSIDDFDFLIDEITESWY